MPLFSHLPQYEHESSLSLHLQVGFSSEELHPAIVRLGLKYAGTFWPVQLEAHVNVSQRVLSVGVTHAAWPCSTPSRSSSATTLLLQIRFLSAGCMELCISLSQVLSLHLSDAIKPLVRFLFNCRPESIRCLSLSFFLSFYLSIFLFFSFFLSLSVF